MKKIKVTYSTQAFAREETDETEVEIADGMAERIWYADSAIMDVLRDYITAAARLKGKNGLTARIKEVKEVE